MQRRFHFNSMPHLGEIYRREAGAMRFKASTVAEAGQWQERLRRKLIDLLGVRRGVRCALRPVIIERIDCGEYVREKVVICSEPGVDVPMYVLVPKEASGPLRPVIAVHGHGAWAADSVVGIIHTEHPRGRQHVEELNYNYGEEFVRRGFIVFAPTSRAHGERMEPSDRFPATPADDDMYLCSCHSVGLNALLLGRTLTGMRVWDIARVIDYIGTRPEPIGEKIGMAGLSGGGTVTLFAAAVDRRVSAAIVAGFFCTFRDSIMTLSHCACNYVPRLALYAEMSDIAGLIAPRPLLVVHGTQDPIFPIAATRKAYRDLKRVYQVCRAEDRLGADFFDGPHRFNGAKAFAWFERWL